MSKLPNLAVSSLLLSPAHYNFHVECNRLLQSLSNCGVCEICQNERSGTQLMSSWRIFLHPHIDWQAVVQAGT